MSDRVAQPGDFEAIRELHTADKRRGKNTSIHLTEFDLEQLAIIESRLKVKRSEAIRTAVRVYAALLLHNKP